MSETHITQAEQQADLQKSLWAAANDLRGNMDASEYRNYMLGLIFYRFLSARTEGYTKQLLENDGLTFVEAYADEDMKEALREEVTNTLASLSNPDTFLHRLSKPFRLASLI